MEGNDKVLRRQLLIKYGADVDAVTVPEKPEAQRHGLVTEVPTELAGQGTGLQEARTVTLPLEAVKGSRPAAHTQP